MLERGTLGEEDLDLNSGCGGELRGGDGTGAVEEHGGLGGIEDGGFDADRGGAGVEDSVDPGVEVGEDVGGGCGAGVAEEIGAGGGDGQAGGEEQSVRDGVGGDADADQFPACGDGVGDGGQTRKEQGERAGPEGLGERPDARPELGGEVRNRAKLLCGSEMHDDRIPGRTLLGSKDAGDGVRGEGVGS